MKWIVGLDLRPSSQGAVAFARWLSQTAAGDTESFVGVHLLEEAHMQAALRYHHLQEVEDAARAALRRLYKDHSVGTAWGEPELGRTVQAEVGLEEARVAHGAGGMILGRQAAREGNQIVRLGRVARRSLRALAAPVVIVPPDLRTGSVGAGPVLALTNLSHDSVAACEAAQDLAARLGRPLEVVHVVPVPQDYGAHYLPPESVAKLRHDHQTEGRKELQTWSERHGFKNATYTLLQGHVQEEVLARAEEVDAAVLVAGSRKMSGFDRLLLTSVGSEMCAHSQRPVMVVPPAP